MEATATLNNPRTVRAWCMYDWANSVYSLVIVSTIYPVYFKLVAVSSPGSDQVRFLGYDLPNGVLLTYSLSCAFLIVAFLLPLLSGIADYSGRKKSFMKAFVFMGSLGCAGLYFFTDVDSLGWGILCTILATVGYSGSLVFYDAFLPEIVTEEKFDATSARGYSMGYYGSVILLIICLVIIMNYTHFGIFSDERHAMRFTFVLTGAWWLGFSTLAFVVLPNTAAKPQGNLLTKGYEELLKVWRALRKSPALKRYLLSFFFFSMGVQTVMYVATLFGTDVMRLPGDRLMLSILLIQIVGAGGSWLFARVSQRIGNKLTLTYMIMLWIGICFAAYVIQTELQFYLLAVLVGMIMGGIQSLGRATYAKLIPRDTVDLASYFSFFDVTFNISIVLGTFSYGLIHQLTGSARNSVLALAAYFVIGLILLATVKDKSISRRPVGGAVIGNR
ncbi:MAG: MFS transporter [Bacteroidota bacterium]|jgi:UMF1 family MFS transporter